MKKLYPKLLIFFFPFFVQAQLYMQKNTSAGSTDNVYIYNKGQLLFVKQDINLKDGSTQDISGNIYLRDDGQLLQGNDNSVNAGNGIVSIYQTGNVNQWDYQFWSLPVSDAVGGAVSNGTNAGNLASNLNGSESGGVGKGGGIFSPFSLTGSDPATFLPAPNYNGSTTSGAVVIADFWLQKYVSNNGYANWNLIQGSDDLLPGEGFTMKGVNAVASAVDYDLRGRPNNGTIKVEVGKDQNTLVGNPYPSAMDLSFFLISNSTTAGSALDGCKLGATAVGQNITGIAYFWESDPSVKSHFLSDYQGGYGTYTPMGCNAVGVYARPTYTNFNEDGSVLGTGTGTTGTGGSGGRQYAPVGQGFFVIGSDQLPTTGKHYLEFHNEFRLFKPENTTSSIFRKAEKKQEQQKLSLNHQNFDSQSGKLITPQLRILTKINNTYARELVTAFYDEATPGFDRAVDGENISFLATDLSYKITGDDRPFNIDVLPYDIDLKLPLTVSADKKTNNFVMQVSNVNYEADGVWLWDKELDEYHDILNESYSFSLPKGQYDDRYAIVFKDKEEALGVTEEVRNSFDVFQNNRAGQLEVLNPMNLELREISVFDILGKQVAAKINTHTDRKTVISSTSWSTGVYVVRVVTADNVEFSKKISVVNK